MATHPFDYDKSETPMRGEAIDHTPLKFGKYKGKTPDWVSEQGKKPESYLVWAYENVAGFPVCSEALYKSCGGKGSRAVAKGMAGKDAAAQPATPKYEFPDDDIPF